jgi:stringent starvation protein B
MVLQKPYLIRAFYDWIVDSECTPYLVVQADYPNTRVPPEHVDASGQIVFNISSMVVKDLQLDNKYIAFEARFSGVKKSIYIPIRAVVAIYAKENGQGMVFGAEEEPLESGGDDSDESSGEDKGGFIKVVK